MLAADGTVSTQMSSGLDWTVDALVFRTAPDQIDTEGVQALEWTTPGDLMSRARLTQFRWRPDIGNQSRFHVIDRLPILGELTFSPEDRDHDRLQP
jgi:hypothetical protein